MINFIKKYFSLVFVPFLVSRFALEVVGHFSFLFQHNPEYPTSILDRGFNFTPITMLDIWMRWDSGWYYSIVSNGYTVNYDILNTQSNIAFFPLYPLLIKIVSLFAIDFSNHGTLYAFFSLLVSNICFLLSLIILTKICEELKFNEKLRSSIIWLIVLYPFSFYFSASYSESTFLLFFTLSFFYLIKEKYNLSSIFGALLAMSRPLGVLIVVPIFFRYILRQKSKIYLKDLLWMSTIPVPFIAFLILAYQRTGDFLAPMHIQSAWGKHFQMPWLTLLPTNFHFPVIHYFDVFFLIASIFILAVYVWKKKPFPEISLYSLFIIITPLFSGSVLSLGRYTIVAIPIYFLLGEIIEKYENLKIPILVLFSMLQAVLFAGFVRGYFVG